jgi:chemotaxis signal transduction protein
MTLLDSSAAPSLSGLSPVAALTRPSPPRLRPAASAWSRPRYGFRVGALGLLIGAECPAELLVAPPLARIPRAPPGLEGIANLRGTLVPVLDLWSLLGIARPSVEAARFLLVLGRQERAAAIRLTAAPQRAGTEQALSSLPPLPEAFAPHAAPGFWDDPVPWLEFSHEGLFAALAAGAAR